MCIRDRPLTLEKVKGVKKNQLKHELKEEAVKLYEEKEAEFPEAEQLRELERVILLKVIDQKWMDQMCIRDRKEALQFLRHRWKET